MKALVLFALTFSLQSHAECSGTALIAFQASAPADFENFKKEFKGGIVESYAVLDAPAADDSFGKINFAILIKGESFAGAARAARKGFKNMKALCGSERLAFNPKPAAHITARLSKWRGENARPLAEKAMVKTMTSPSVKYGIFEKAAVRVGESEGFQPLDDIVLFAFDRETGRAELAQDRQFKYTESLFNKIYTTNYLYLEMKPL